MARKLNIIGAKLRDLRMRKGLTQEQLAARCGVLGWDVSAKTLAKMETHLRSAFDCELIVLVRALRVNFSDLIPIWLSRARLRQCLNKPYRKPKRRMRSRRASK